MKFFQRRTYVVDQGYQLRAAGAVVCAGLLLGLLAGACFVWSYHFMLDPRMHCRPGIMLPVLGAVLALSLVLGLFGWAVRRTHAVAGPVPRFRDGMREALQGRYVPVAFRAGDYFEDLQRDINLCMQGAAQNVRCARELRVLLEEHERHRLTGEELRARLKAMVEEDSCDA
jgi:hypothetical protein